MQVYRELKQEIGSEEYLEHVKGAPSRLFLGCIQVPIRCLRSWIGMHECPNGGACKESVEHVLIECGSYDSHRD